MKAAVLFCLGLFFIGCATVGDIRTMAPDKILESDLSPQKIANCINFKAPEKTHYRTLASYDFHLSENPPGTFHILVQASNQPLGEVDLKPNEKGGTIIEFRNGRYFWAKDAFWNCIKHCAAVDQ